MPSKPDFETLQQWAANDARMCEIILAADKLVAAFDQKPDSHGVRAAAIRAALDAYKVVRNGQ